MTSGSTAGGRSKATLLSRGCQPACHVMHGMTSLLAAVAVVLTSLWFSSQTTATTTPVTPTTTAGSVGVVEQEGVCRTRYLNSGELLIFFSFERNKNDQVTHFLVLWFFTFVCVYLDVSVRERDRHR